MTERRVHPDQLPSNPALVRQLITSQFPQWSHLPITPVLSNGTENAIYRLGEKLAIRLPLRPVDDYQIRKLHTWLPYLSPQLPLKVPLIRALGEPIDEFRAPWAIVDWLEGDEVSYATLQDPVEAAETLATFCRTLIQLNPADGPAPGRHNFIRGVPLIDRHEMTCSSIERCSPHFDTTELKAAWEKDLNAPVWHRTPTWLHGDIAPDNLLQVNGKLTAVIDWGGLAVGDPATEFLPAWNLFRGQSRQVYRETMDLDDATWYRGRALALSTAVVSMPYYMNTIPERALKSKLIIEDILSDHRHQTS